jgi:two-component sensor histidine kinase
MIQGLLGSMVRSSHSVPEFYRAFSHRIASLARTQKLLTENLWAAAPLDEMLEQELRLYLEQGPGRIRTSGPRLELPADLAIPVGMALHELTSNAGRHGALSVSRGCVEIIWDVKESSGARHLWLCWKEHDGPPVREPEHSGFGSMFLSRILPFQSNAKVDVSYRPDGVAVEIEAPLMGHPIQT